MLLALVSVQTRNLKVDVQGFIQSDGTLDGDIQFRIDVWESGMQTLEMEPPIS